MFGAWLYWELHPLTFFTESLLFYLFIIIICLINFNLVRNADHSFCFLFLSDEIMALFYFKSGYLEVSYVIFRAGFYFEIKSEVVYLHIVF